MKRVSLAVTFVLALLVAATATAQTIREGSISTAGANCSTSTNCSALIDMKGAESVSIYINVATSGTFNFEYSNDATSLTDGTWTALNDDIDAASTLTADGTKFFTNPGYRYLRVRASAISGTATYKVTRGYVGLKSTATLSGGGDASAANQVTGNGYLATLAGTVSGGNVNIAGSITASATNTDADAATITAGQTSDTVNSLGFVYNGSAWARLTFGQATMANSLPVVIASNQGALSVTSNSANIATEATLGNVLTSSNFAAAFGTAGTADSQVMSVQGIASGTTLRITPTDSVGDSAVDNTANAVKVLNVDSTGTAISPGVACTNVAVIDTAASGNTQLVALSGSTVIYVCSYIITAEATVDVRLVRGTGTACATGETSITGTFAFSTTTGLLGVSRGSGLGMITKGTAGDAVCIETSGAVQINGEITYAQY